MRSAAQLESGMNFFNARQYFEAHEAWEDLWRDTAGPLRQFYQGLIQAAVGLYHLEHGNAIGGRSQLKKAVRNLRSYSGSDHGLDAASFIEQLEAILAEEDPSGLTLAARIARLK
jgi:uncharacterized protein